MLQKQYLRKLGKHPKYLPPTVSPPGRSVSRVIYIYIYCCIYSELPARYQCQAYANTKITNNMGLQRYPLFDFKIGLTLIPPQFFLLSGSHRYPLNLKSGLHRYPLLHNRGHKYTRRFIIGPQRYRSLHSRAHKNTSQFIKWADEDPSSFSFACQQSFPHWVCDKYLMIGN